MVRQLSLVCLVFGLFTVGACAGELDVAQRPDATTAVDLVQPDLVKLVDQATPADLGGKFSFKDWMPDKKGLWIWYWDYIGMTPAVAAEKCKTLGVGWVLIKSGQDANFWTDRYNEAAVAEFTSRGIRVVAWPYITPKDIPGSIAAAVKAAKVPGTDGLVLDVEVEWEQNGDHSAAATQLCQGIRAGAPDAFLAYTSYGWVGYHGSFPWKAFDADCGDAYFPQVYFSDRGVSWDGSKGLSQALDMYTASKLQAPLWVAGSNDDIAGTSSGPTTADLNAFMDAAGVRTTLWEFPTKASPSKLTQLSDLHWAN